MGKVSSYDSGFLSDSMMLILACAMHPVHGYKIMRELKERSSGLFEIGPTTMYRTLKKMKIAGWIKEIEHDEARVFYQTTDLGSQVLKRDLVRRKMILEIAEEFLI